MRAQILTLAFACTLAVGFAPATNAFDLTGHWTGRWNCKGFDGSKFIDVNKTSTLDVTQSGTTINAVIDGKFIFTAAAIFDDKKPDEKGEAALIACGTNLNLEVEDANSEIIRASVKTKIDRPKAILDGVSVLENDVAPFGEEIQTCKYGYNRIDSIDPGVLACPTTMMSARRSDSGRH